MSIADTADYQLEALASTLAELSNDVSQSAEHSNLYKQAYNDALLQVGTNMGLKVSQHYTFKY
jgi:hypothetical protein